MELSIEKIDNKKDWNDFIKESRQGTVFNSKHYFDVFNDKIDLWFITRKNNPKLAIPILRNGPLPFSYYQGPIFSKEINAFNDIKKFQWSNKLLSFAINKLCKEYNKLFFSLHWSVSDIRSFLWYNYNSSDSNYFEILPSYTAVINYKKYENFKKYQQCLRRDRRQDLKYAYKNSIEIRKSSDGTNILNLYIETLSEKKTKVSKLEKEILTKIMYLIEKKNLGFIFKAYYKKNLIAAQVVLEDNFYSHGIVLVGLKEMNKLGVKTLLTLEWIKDAMFKGLIIDFNGANSPNLADYKHSMGAEPQVFFKTSLI